MNNGNTIVKGDVAEVFLYGEIANNPGGDGVVTGVDVVTELKRLSSEVGRINVHINSEGGEVYAGIAIFNALRSCECDVAIYTDGISASIAGVIAMCGRPHYMSRYSRLMVHSVSAGVYGNKDDLQVTIDEINALEDTLAQIISERMGDTPEEVKAAYFDGKDHWFTAGQAVEAGLADGIYDLDAVDMSEAGDDAPAQDIYRKVFVNRAVIRSQIINDMFDYKNLNKRVRFENVRSEEDVLRVIDGLLEEREALERENEQLKERNRQLEGEDIERILEAAVAAGKIDEGEKDDYRALLNTSRQSAEKVLRNLKPRRRVVEDLRRGEGEDAGTWDGRMESIRRSLKAGRG